MFKSACAASKVYSGCSKLWKVYQQEVVHCGFKDSKILEWRLALPEEYEPFLEQWKKEVNYAHSGKTFDETVKNKMSMAHKGSVFWHKDGVNCRAKECPGEGWTRGKIR